jgi:hypothetical protein
MTRFFALPKCRDALHKLAASYLAFVQLASIRQWLRVNESTPGGGGKIGGKIARS